MRGYVYILTNPAIPGQVKIGRTERPVNLRVRELASTGVPQPFNTEFYCEVNDCITLERELHGLMLHSRTTHRKEWFQSDLQVILRLTRRVLKTGRYRVYSVEGPYRHQFTGVLLSRRRWRRLILIGLVLASLYYWSGERNLGVHNPAYDQQTVH